MRSRRAGGGSGGIRPTPAATATPGGRPASRPVRAAQSSQARRRSTSQRPGSSAWRSLRAIPRARRAGSGSRRAEPFSQPIQKLPSTSSRPSRRVRPWSLRAAATAKAFSGWKSGSPPPSTSRSSPAAEKRVANRCWGPSRSSAQRVVATFTSEAGLMAASGWRLSSARPSRCSTCQIRPAVRDEPAPWAGARAMAASARGTSTRAARPPGRGRPWIPGVKAQSSRSSLRASRTASIFTS